MWVTTIRDVTVVDREQSLSLSGTKMVAQKVVPDGKEPAPKRRLGSPGCQPAKRPEECLLNQIIYVLPVGAGGVEKSPQRRAMALDQFRCRTLVAAAICGYQDGIGFGVGAAGSGRRGGAHPDSETEREQDC